MPIKPDVVVSIKDGGWYAGKRLSQELSVPHLCITIGRPINYKRLYGLFPRGLRLFPALIHGVLFLTLKPVLVKKLGKEEGLLVKNRRILLVDDVVQSGRTLTVATTYLARLAPYSIHTAVLGDVCDKNIPDFTCLGGIHYYPWSKSSPEYKNYLSMRAEQA